MSFSLACELINSHKSYVHKEKDLLLKESVSQERLAKLIRRITQPLMLNDKNYLIYLITAKIKASFVLHTFPCVL